MREGYFPPELLEMSIEDRKNYFSDEIVGHEIAKNLKKHLLREIQFSTPQKIIALIGITGVGKTRLCYKVAESFLESQYLSMQNDLGYIPIIMSSLKSPESGNFDWKDLYLRLYGEIEEQLINYKIVYEEEGKIIHPPKRLRPHSNNSKNTADLRRCLTESIIQRNVKAIILDEGQHLTKMTSGRRLLDQMDALKSFSDEINSLVILSGTYGLLDLLNLSDQLGRRIKPLHFPAYSSEQLEDFAKVLGNFEIRLPVKIQPKLRKHTQYIHKYSCGCIGILKNWLEEALVLCLTEGAKTVTFEMLEATKLMDGAVAKINEELRNGIITYDALSGNNKKISATNQKPRGRRIPGKRKPVRDPVGHE